MNNFKLIFVYFLFLTTCCFIDTFGQVKEGVYIQNKIGMEVFTLNSMAYNDSRILNVGVFDSATEKIQWGTQTTIIEYIYLGIDNNNNLHLERVQSGSATNQKYMDKCTLIFPLDSNKTADIILIGERFYTITPFKIKVKIENNALLASYVGELPKLVE